MSHNPNTPENLSFLATLWAKLQEFGYLDQFREMFGINPDTPLGHGCWGIVWETNDPCKVLKVTLDPTEGPITAYMLKHGLDKSLQGVATVHNLWKLRETIADKELGRDYGISDRYPVVGENVDDVFPIYVILRENIRPRGISKDRYQVMDKERWARDYEYRESILAENELIKFRDLASDLTKLENTTRKERKEWELNNWTMSEAIKEIQDNMWNAIGEMSGHQPTYNIAIALEELWRDHDIILRDVHFGNIGYRTCEDPELEKYASDFEWTIFDLGHSSIEGKIPRIRLWKKLKKALKGIPPMPSSSPIVLHLQSHERPSFIHMPGIGPFDIPESWEIWNAPRPIMGTQLDMGVVAWQGEFRHGVFFTAINPDDPEANRWRQHNMGLDAWIIKYVTPEELELWADEYYTKEHGLDWREEIDEGFIDKGDLWRSYVRIHSKAWH